MARQVYSQQLLLVHALSAATMSVPTGKRWVIRGMTFFFPSAVLNGSFQAVDVATGATWWTDSAAPLGGSIFHQFTDLRIVFDEGAESLLTGTESPDVGFYGYELSLP